MNIAFVWQESSKPEVFNHWNDGLRAAMTLVEKQHNVIYREPWDYQDFTDRNIELILYWEAPCTINGPNAHHYNNIRHLPIRKIMLFAGGPIKKEWVEGFDLLLVESKINAEECASLNIPYDIAFGVNTDIFKPQKQNKVFDAIHHGTFAAWKHQPLIAEALGPKALLVGKFQPHEQFLIDDSLKFGAVVLPKTPYEILPYLLSSAHTCINMADVWGGGQRTTLEAMACGIPVLCRNDSPKNMEYIQESGFGEIIPPATEQIIAGVGRLKTKALNLNIGVNYVNSKWTHRHYAEAILKHI